MITRVFRQAGLTPQTRFAVRDTATIFAMVQEGLGVTLVPALTLPKVMAGLCALPLVPTVEWRLALAFPSREGISPATRTVLALAAERVPTRASPGAGEPGSLA